MTNPRGCAETHAPAGVHFGQGSLQNLKPEAWHTREAAGPQELGLALDEAGYVRTVDSTVGHLARSTFIHYSEPPPSSVIFLSYNRPFVLSNVFLRHAMGGRLGSVSRYKLRFKYRHITMPSRMLKGNCPVV